jgi:hypothetical protein
MISSSDWARRHAGGFEARIGEDADDGRYALLQHILRGDDCLVLFVECQRMHLGSVAVDGDGGNSLDRGHVGKVIAVGALVDGKIGVERHQYRWDHAFRIKMLGLGHVGSPS